MDDERLNDNNLKNEYENECKTSFERFFKNFKSLMFKYENIKTGQIIFQCKRSVVVILLVKSLGLVNQINYYRINAFIPFK